jgi:GDP-L-fucose synthase
MAARRAYVAGHRGMVGSALVRRLAREDDVEVVTADRSELDLLDARQVAEWFAAHSVDEVYLAAAKVGGIAANRDYPADFIVQNLLIEANVVRAAHEADVDRLLFLGSSCIYPRDAAQPMAEDALLTGTLEPTNEPYAIAKIAGIKLCESYNRQHGRDYRSVMPTNLYGPNDNFDPTGSHVLPALMRRFDEAARSGADHVEVWGSGRPRREFLHVDDMADACVHVMGLDAEVYRGATDVMLSHVNVGTGTDCSIAELAQLVAAATGFEGEIRFDPTKPDGTPRKLLDVRRLTELGWTSSIPLEQGLKDTYDWYAAQEAVRGR